MARKSRIDAYKAYENQFNKSIETMTKAGATETRIDEFKSKKLGKNAFNFALEAERREQKQLKQEGKIKSTSSNERLAQAIAREQVGSAGSEKQFIAYKRGNLPKEFKGLKKKDFKYGSERYDDFQRYLSTVYNEKKDEGILPIDIALWIAKEIFGS